jgi:DNA polymerase III alpha subunit
MNTEIDSGIEFGLDSLDRARRERALAEFHSLSGEAAKSPSATRPGNLHAHTFFSYNCRGYSPARYALLARRHGMEVAGIVDFDVLDGMAEFHDAGRRLNLRTVVSLETRVFVPEFADRVINSPGEPGVAYHMAAGFARLPEGAAADFLCGLRDRATHRNRSVVARVNAFLEPAAISYDADALALTPAGNATERHLVLAYARKAARRSSRARTCWPSGAASWGPA